MNVTKHLSFDQCEVKFSGNTGSFEGYASTFNNVDSYGDTILPGAYKSVIDQGGLPKMLFNHRHWEIPVGKWTHMSEDSKGLVMRGEFTPGNPQAQTLKAAMQHGTIDGLSIGYALKEGDFEQKGDTRLIKQVSRLHEVSVVTWPADESARIDISSVKSALGQIVTIRDFEDYLRDAGGFSKGAAMALAAHAKRLFSPQGEPVAQLPQDLAELLRANLRIAQSL